MARITDDTPAPAPEDDAPEASAGTETPQDAPKDAEAPQAATEGPETGDSDFIPGYPPIDPNLKRSPEATKAAERR